ncbi:MAG: F0F1 ATP synthase subunit A [Phycisphaerae bacterium]|nr:F0F1 ATP synthase subunit A [Phycisphaerae bacterium]NUQ46014.1 F0F1 ATP synthase subunit A [Phycisphaerae bacterium]
MNILASGSPLEHVVQHPFVQWHVNLPLFGEQTITILSDQIIMQMIAGVLAILVTSYAARRYSAMGAVNERLVPRGIGNFIEVICDYLRKNVAAPALGPYTDAFVPYLWTAFFFILFSNILGLVPSEPFTRYFFFGDSALTHGHGIGGTATGNVFVTGTLAACTLLMIVVNGLRLQGMAFVKHFFQGPFPISVLIAGLEVIGLCAKTFALTMRLFANMVAGHVLLAVLLSFISLSAASLGSAGGFLIALVVVLGSVAINLLELFVAFLQAFIFTFLTAMFIGQAVNIHHDHEHEEAHGEAHAH